MALVGMVLLSALTLLLSVTRPAYSETSMNVSYSWKRDGILRTNIFYINFSSDLFDTFHSCLCDNSHTQCCMRLRLRSKGLKWITSSKYHYSSYNYEANNPYSCEQKQDHWYNVQSTYSSIYECDFHSRSHHYSPLLKCSRVKQDDEKQENALKTSFSIRGHADYCSVPCVTVRWGGKQTLNNVTSTARGFYDGSYCVADSLKRSTSSDSATTTQSTVPSTTKSTVPPTTNSTVPPATSIPRTRKTTWKTTQKIQTTKTESQAWETTTQTIQQTDYGEDNTEVSPNKDDTSYLVAVYVVPGVILIVVIVIFMIIWRRKRKQQQRRPSIASRHDVPRAGAISQNIGEVRDGNVGGTVHNSWAASSRYEALNGVGDAYVPTEGATACGFTAVFERGKGFTSDYTNTSALRSTSGASNVYSRPGNQIRKFENPYVDIPALKANFHKTSGLGENTVTQDSLAMTSLKSSSSANQNNFHINVTELVSQSFANKAYECVDIENTDSNTKVAFDALQGTSDAAYEVIGTGESEYTNFPMRDPTIDTEESEYANFTGRDPAIGTAESEYTNFPKRDTAFGKEKSAYEQVISTEESEYDAATDTEESQYDPATGTEESEYDPATGTEESEYDPAPGTEESEYTNFPKRDPAIGTEESEYANFPRTDPEPTQSVYARLGEPVRDIENPYDG